MKIAIITSCFLPIIDGVTVSGLQRLKMLSKWGHEVIFFESISQQLNLTKVAIIVAGDGPMRSQIAAKLNTLAPTSIYWAEYCPVIS
ncbi:MAG: hypothetical protein QNJ72_31275 [Pleurocapsa sp. MO_226.B13]|nr:hypothetical protein [Pleurocapsa sp. MO_226.B13]